MGIDESEILLGAAFGAALPYALTALVEWTQHKSLRGMRLLHRFGLSTRIPG